MSTPGRPGGAYRGAQREETPASPEPMAPPPPSWRDRVSLLLDEARRRGPDEGDHACANHLAVLRTLQGKGPDKDKVVRDAGARVVVNLSSAHVPGFCRSSRQWDPKPYKNCYDLHKLGIGSVSAHRAAVDIALPLPKQVLQLRNVYYGAVELNGAGIRFYGDVGLVLKLEHTERLDPVLLDRNSFDVLRAPVSEQVGGELPPGPEAEQADWLRKRRAALLSRWSGRWSTDLGHMAAVKALQSVPVRHRRWTTGMISEAVRSDEDYLEVLMTESFGAADLQEARFALGESALDALVASRVARRPRPRLETLVWFNRRRRAEVALRAVGVPIRVLTTSGRTKD
jgi:hypothetical protein